MTVQTLLRGTSLLALAAVAFSSGLSTGVAWAADPAAVANTALPTGGRVVGGAAAISTQGAQMTVRQSSQTLITNWQTFDVGKSAGVRFEQPNAAAVAVNRVTGGGGASQIQGAMTGNGRVFLINPAGVVIGPSARVDVGGLVASSLDLSDEDAAKGRVTLNGSASRGAVSNRGEVAAKEGGFVALVAPQVSNEGTITAPGGTVALAAGQKARLELNDGGLIGVEVQAAVAGARVDNRGTVAADGGRVIMTARQAGPMIATAVNQQGVVRADTVNSRNGEIWLDAGPNGAAQVGGTVQARGNRAGETGGRVVATGDQVTVSGTVDASGRAGGGTVAVGGGWQGKDPAIREAARTTVTADAKVTADANEKGAGGTVSVWSRERTEVRGTVSAQGSPAKAGTPAGKGGKVETSSKGTLAVEGKVRVGTGGTWLLDPTTVTVVSSGGGAVGTSSVNASNIETVLNTGGNVELLADDSITISADISKTAGGTSTLTFLAPNGITLGAPGVSRNISAVNNVATPTTTSSLNVVFGSDTLTGGTVTLYGQVSTNGGTFTSYKPVTLANAQPISTRVLAVNPSNQANTPDSGSVTFKQAVTLSSSGSVTIDTQSVQDATNTYIRRGGDVSFEMAVLSADINAPRPLIVNTTGAVAIGGVDANYSGRITFAGNVGTTAGPLDSLTVIGPSFTFLNTDQINLRKQSGNTLTFSAPGSYRPTLVLGRQDTVVTVTGFTAGSADYTQTTFDIALADGLTGTPSLTIRSDRSVRITDSKITAVKVNAAGTALTETTLPLTLTVSPSQRTGASSGAIALQNATIRTYGGNVAFASADARAFGVATEQNTDAIRLQASIIDTTGTAADGTIGLYGQAATSSSTGGNAITMTGQTQLKAGRSDIVINGRVASTSGGADKDAVVIGAGGQSTVRLETTSGRILVTGDAGSVGLAATTGASYNGVEISDAALIVSTSGAIEIRGTGGGGNNRNVGENHGIVLKDDNTQIVSTTGNILLVGQTGGKTSSYGLRATGNSISIGQQRNADTNVTTTGQPIFTGNVDLVADTMSFVNTASSRLRVTGQRNGADLATGQLNIRPLHDVAVQIGGTEPNPPSPDNPSAPTTSLYLASSWFSGSTAVFLPGFGEVNVGRFAEAGTASTKTLTVAGATTVRDPLNLIMAGTGGAVQLDALLTVRGTATDATANRVLSILTGGGVTGTANASVISVNAMLLSAGGDVTLSGPNLIGTLAAVSTGGSFRLSNAQALTVDTVTTTRLGATVTDGQVKTTDKAVTLATTAGGLTLAKIVDAGVNTGGTVALIAAGAVQTTGTAIVRAERLSVTAGATSTLSNVNQVGTLAGSVTGDLVFRGRDGIAVASVTDLAGTTVDGLTVSGTATLTADAGALTQSKRVSTGALVATTTGGGIDLSALGTNRLGTLTADATGGEIKIRNEAALTLNALVARSAGQGIAVRTTGGNLLVADAITAGTAGSRGIVRLEATAGAVTQTAAAANVITASALTVRARDTSVLGNDNQVPTLAAAITGAGQGLSFAGVGGITVGTVAANTGADAQVLVAETPGIQAPGAVELVARNGDIVQTHAIGAGSLNLLAVTGAVTLENAGNAIGTLAATLSGAGKAMTLRDSDGFTVGTVANRIGTGSRSGITTSNGTLALTAIGTDGSAADTLIVDRTIDTGTAAVTLTAQQGGVSVSATTGIVRAGRATLTGARAVSVAGEVTTRTGDATLTSSAAGVTVAGTVTAATTIAATGQTTLAVSGTLQSQGGTTTLAATTGALSVTGSVTASTSVQATAGNGMTLDGPVTAQAGTVVATASTGDVAILDPISATTGITVTATTGAITSAGTLRTTTGAIGLQAQTGIAVSANVTADAGAVTIVTTTGALSVTGAAVDAAQAATLRADAGTLTVAAAAGATPAASVTGLSAALTARDRLLVGGSVTSRTGATTLTSTAADITVPGTLSAGTVLTATARTDLSIAGSATARGGNAALTATTGAISLTGPVTASAAIVGTAGTDVGSSGTLRAGTGIGLTATAGAATLGGTATTDAGDLTVEARTGLTSGATLTATAGDVGLTASNGAVSLTGGTVTAGGRIAATARGATGNLSTAAAMAAGTGVTLTSGSGTVGITARVRTTGGDVVVSSGQTATLSSDVTADAGALSVTATTGNIRQTAGALTAQSDVTLTATAGDVVQSAGASLTAARLAVRATGPVTLKDGTNDVELIAATVGTTGQSLSFVDTDTLTVGTVGGVTGITTTGGDVGIQTAGTLTLQAGVSTGGRSAGTVALVSTGGGIDGSVAGVVANALLVRAAQAVTLNTGTDVATVAGSVGSGALDIVSAGAVRVGTVAATLPTARTATGLDTAAGNGNIRVASTGGGVALDQAVRSGTGILAIGAAGPVSQAVAITVGALRVVASGPVTLTDAGNRANRVAASVTGPNGFRYRENGALRIDSVTAFGTTTDGIAAGGAVAVHAVGDLTVLAAVSGSAAGREAVVLRAQGLFRNAAGAAGVRAPNGRWLIYDESPLYVDRLGGLPVAFRRFETAYGAYPPPNVAEPGNGFITTARIVDPDQYVRMVGGTTSGSDGGGNSTAPVGVHDGRSGMAPRASVQQVVDGTGLSAIPLVQRPVGFTGTGATDVQFAAPLTIAPVADRPFESAIGGFTPGGRLEGATLADGQPLPDWLSLDAERGTLAGRTPAGQSEPVEVRVQVRLADGSAASLPVRIAPTAVGE